MAIQLETIMEVLTDIKNGVYLPWDKIYKDSNGKNVLFDTLKYRLLDAGLICTGGDCGLLITSKAWNEYLLKYAKINNNYYTVLSNPNILIENSKYAIINI